MINPLEQYSSIPQFISSFFRKKDTNPLLDICFVIKIYIRYYRQFTFKMVLRNLKQKTRNNDFSNEKTSFVIHHSGVKFLVESGFPFSVVFKTRKTKTQAITESIPSAI